MLTSESPKTSPRYAPLHANPDGAHIPFTIEPVYDGEQWNDVLQIQMGNRDTGGEVMEYAIKIFACDVAICP